MSDFNLVLVKDATIGDLTPQLDYAVKSGASSCTYQTFKATSVSNSSMSFNIVVPSESIVLDRHLMLKTTFGIQLTIANVQAGARALDLGLTSSLQSFPISSNMTSCTAQINNTSVSVNLKDILPLLMRCTNLEDLEKYNATAPVMPDNMYYDYSQMKATNCNPMASANNGSYSGLVPRGAFRLDQYLYQRYADVNDYAANANPVVTNISANAANVFKISLQRTVTEPIATRLQPCCYRFSDRPLETDLENVCGVR